MELLITLEHKDIGNNNGGNNNKREYLHMVAALDREQLYQMSSTVYVDFVIC